MVPPREWRPDPDYALPDFGNAVSETRDYLAAGGKTLVEMTAIGQRIDVRLLRAVSEATDAHIIITTGFSQEPSMPRLPFDASEDEIAALMVREVLEGAENTDVRAGVIKAGSSFDRITGAEMKVFRAAARAQRETGAPISTHTTGGSAAMLQVETLSELGADLRRVAIGHVDRFLQYGYLRMIAQSGVSLVFDGIAKTKYGSDELRAEMITHLVADGFLDNILLAFDNGRRSYFPSYGGAPGTAHVLRHFVPLLTSSGMSEQQVRRIVVENPARLFAF
jgi:phosphotriesterase-related protein